MRRPLLPAIAFLLLAVPLTATNRTEAILDPSRVEVEARVGRLPVLHRVPDRVSAVAVQ